MKKPPTLLLCSLLAACATTGGAAPSNDEIPRVPAAASRVASGLPAELPSSEPSSRADRDGRDEARHDGDSYAAFFSRPVTLPAAGSELRRYMMLKGGYFRPDASAAGDGFLANLVYGVDLGSILSLEVEGGYFQTEVDVPGVDLYGVPIMVNGRAGVPLGIFEAYGGAGVGTMYYDVDAPGALGDNGWMFAGNAFLGADALLDRWALGLEVKYYMTEKVGGAIDDDLNALAAFLKVGVRF